MLKTIKETIYRHRYKILAGVSFTAAAYLFYLSLNDNTSIKLSSFLEALTNHQLEQVIIRGSKVYFRSALSEWFHTSIEGYPRKQLFQIINEAKVAFACEEENVFPIMVSTVATAGLSAYFFERYFLRSLNPAPKKRAISYEKREEFSHFFGGENIKLILTQIIQKLKDPKKYLEMRVRMRRGILFHGPPGTGKTLLARILASQAGIPFISTSASEFEQIFVGVGPKKIRQIFQQARKSENGCIIFIDELDAIGSRNQNWQTKEQRSTINQLLTEIDGFAQNQNILVIGATNNITLVDKALLRPGRFDLKIFIPPPGIEERIGILQTIIKRTQIPVNLSEQDYRNISSETEGWCGAHLENLLNESGYLAIRHNKKYIQKEQIVESLNLLREVKADE